MIAGILATLLVTTPTIPLPPATQYVQSAWGSCPDGATLEIAVYDPRPETPASGDYIIVYKRGDQVLAVHTSATKMIYVVAVAQTMSLGDAQARWASPCDLPVGMAP